MVVHRITVQLYWIVSNRFTSMANVFCWLLMMTGPLVNLGRRLGGTDTLYITQAYFWLTDRPQSTICTHMFNGILFVYI